MTQYDNLAVGSLSFLRKKGSPQERLHAERGKQIGADGGAFHPNRLLILPVDEVPRPPACDLFKSRALILQVNEIRRRNPNALFTRLLVLPEDLREPTRVFVRKRLEYESVDCAEDGRVRPDAQRQRKHRHGGEAGVLQQLTEGVAKVVHIFDLRFTIWSVVPCQL